MTAISSLQQSGFPPERLIFPVDRLDLAVLPGAHPWMIEHRDAVAANWSREVAANPHLFDGQMVFQRHLSCVGGCIAGQAHMAPFSAFLHWRRERPAGGFHLFGLPLMLSGDGALIAIRMADTTANPGRVYCPAGSMDALDVVDGHCDIDLNMRREVLEETGYDLADAEAGPGYFGLHAMNSVTIFRTFRFSMPAAAMVAAITAHAADDPEPEVAEVLALRDADPHAHDYPFFMPIILQWLFDR